MQNAANLRDSPACPPMLRAFSLVSVLATLAGCGSAERALTAPASSTPDAPETSECVSNSAPPWQTEWLAAWDLTSAEVLVLPDAPAPDIVFFDGTCVYTTSPVAAPSADAVPGPGLRGTLLAWRASPHGGTLTLPDSSGPG